VFFVTGTDTGVGKTTFTCAIAAALLRRGLRVGVSKPIETGCDAGPDGALVPADAVRLKYFSDCRADLSVVCPYRFRQPLAPSVAARREGAKVEIDRLTTSLEHLVPEHDVTLVEGAGGLLVPIADGLTFADLARRWDVPVLVVVGNRLGALNQAQLTVRMAEMIGLRVAGYAINSLLPVDDLAAQSNRETLPEILGPSLGVLPWLGTIEHTRTDRDRLADAAESSFDLGALVGGGHARTK
jgi:dethiobiotin synthetase